MRKAIYLFVFITIHATVFPQAKLRDGIYLVDQSKNKSVASKLNKEAIQFNQLFVAEGPEEYYPIIIFTDDFAPFELTDAPIIQFQKNQENLLFVNLTENASEKLKEFTTRNMMNHIVVVVNGEALSVYKVIQPVASRLVNITKCNKNGCDQIYKRLKSTVTK
ncbi:MAG: hypothetical protein ABI863_00920 [Ginsengibacter sp.]